jgi:hypothetical protein
MAGANGTGAAARISPFIIRWIERNAMICQYCPRCCRALATGLVCLSCLASPHAEAHTHERDPAPARTVLSIPPATATVTFTGTATSGRSMRRRSSWLRCLPRRRRPNDPNNGAKPLGCHVPGIGAEVVQRSRFDPIGRYHQPARGLFGRSPVPAYARVTA